MRKYYEEMKKNEWKELVAEYLQTRKDVENNDEDLLSRFEKFIENPPEELHKDEALTIINNIKVKINEKKNA